MRFGQIAHSSSCVQRPGLHIIQGLVIVHKLYIQVVGSDLDSMDTVNIYNGGHSL